MAQLLRCETNCLLNALKLANPQTTERVKNFYENILNRQKELSKFKAIKAIIKHCDITSLNNSDSTDLKICYQDIEITKHIS